MSAFSNEIPTLRLAWDATTLDSYMRCPLTYYWKDVLGYRQESTAVALLFGTLYHDSVGQYEQARLHGKDVDSALREAITWLLAEAKEKGFADISASSRDAKTRNIRNLVRALIWFSVWTERDEVYERCAMPDGSSSIEVSWAMPLGIKAPTGEDYILSGSLDQVKRRVDDGSLVVNERKTTTTTIGSYYWKKFNPNVQIWTYDLIGSMVLGSSGKLRGVVVEACQSAVHFTRFDREEIVRTRMQREQWLESIKYWIRRAEADAINHTWAEAMNPATLNWENVYRTIQTKSPKMWDRYLEMELKQREPWNPLDQGKAIHQPKDTEDKQ